MIVNHFCRSTAKLVEVVAMTRARPASLSITYPAHGEPLHPFCGALSRTSTPSSVMSTHSAPDAMQSRTNSPPAACVAAATVRT